MNFDWTQRITLGLAVLLFLFFLAYSLHLRNEAIRTGTAPTSSIPGTVKNTQALPAATTAPLGKVDLSKPQPHSRPNPKQTPPGDQIHIEQRIEGPGGKNYAVGKGNLIVNEVPPSRELSAENEAKVRDALSATNGSVRIIMLGSNNGEAQRLTEQIRRIFDGAHWQIQPLSIGVAPVPPGIHLVGDPDNPLVIAAKRAFDSVHLDCVVGPSYAGPLGAGAAPPLTITVGPHPD